MYEAQVVSSALLIFCLLSPILLLDTLFVGLPVLIPENEESVLLGSAILAACASQEFPSVQVQYVTWICRAADTSASEVMTLWYYTDMFIIIIFLTLGRYIPEGV